MTLEFLRKEIVRILHALLYLFRKQVAKPPYLSNRLIKAWFAEWLERPDYFWGFEEYSMSPEYRFVCQMILALGDD